MTIEELLSKINRGLRAGTYTELDSVFVLDPNVSAAAASAGSSRWREADELLAISGSDDLEDGIYLAPEGWDDE